MSNTQRRTIRLDAAYWPVGVFAEADSTGLFALSHLTSCMRRSSEGGNGPCSLWIPRSSSRPGQIRGRSVQCTALHWSAQAQTRETRTAPRCDASQSCCCCHELSRRILGIPILKLRLYLDSLMLTSTRRDVNRSPLKNTLASLIQGILIAEPHLYQAPLG